MSALRFLRDVGGEAAPYIGSIVGRLADPGRNLRCVAHDLLAGLDHRVAPHAEAIVEFLWHENSDVCGRALSALCKFSIAGIDCKSKVHEAVQKSLLARGIVNITAFRTRGYTRLHSDALICANISVQTLQTLLDVSNVDVNKASDGGNGETPLYLAAREGNEAVVALLLEASTIDVNRANALCGRTPLHIAVHKWHKAVVYMLLRAPDIDVNQACGHGWNPIHIAALHGPSSVVEALIETPGIDMNCENGEGHTPLQIAL